MFQTIQSIFLVSDELAPSSSLICKMLTTYQRRILSDKNTFIKVDIGMLFSSLP